MEKGHEITCTIRIPESQARNGSPSGVSMLACSRKERAQKGRWLSFEEKPALFHKGLKYRKCLGRTIRISRLGDFGARAALALFEFDDINTVPNGRPCLEVVILFFVNCRNEGRIPCI